MSDNLERPAIYRFIIRSGILVEDRQFAGVNSG